MRFPLNCHTPHIGPDCGTLAQFSAGQRLLEGPEAEVNLRAEGKRSGSAEIRPHTPIVAYHSFQMHNRVQQAKYLMKRLYIWHIFHCIH